MDQIKTYPKFLTTVSSTMSTILNESPKNNQGQKNIKAATKQQEPIGVKWSKSQKEFQTETITVKSPRQQIMS